MRIKHLECKHVAKADGGYLYKLIEGDIDLCKACERQLRKQIITQMKLEKDITIRMKKAGI